TMIVMIMIHAWQSQSRLTALALPSIGLAGASLRGIWRIDRQCLLIPDRLQALGCAAGLYYFGAFIATGEPWRDQSLELAIAFALVGLMWALSASYLRVRGAVGFGFGDIKLLGWLAFFVGKRMIDLILYSIVIGLVYLLVSTAVKSIKAKRIMLPGSQDAFAFGPAIVLAVIAEALLHDA
ncbi:MAG: prepilin peptidase, partial [Proteobacteria bacterium]|nr:prepilin peptidase [Pseudomonadota bacterium]